MRSCKNCGIEKQETEFFRDGGLAGGRANTCKICKQEKTYAWREKNKDKYNEYMRKMNKERYPDARLAQYGVTNDWYQTTLKAQDYKCAICRKPNPSTKRTLATDHCHKTDKVRGLLCYGCNRLMVLLDNEELLAKALAYKNST